MRPSLVLVSALVSALPLAILAVPGAAHAQRTSWQATANGDVAVTDNVFAAPNDTEREADLFFQVRPGVVFSYNAPRKIHELLAELDVIHYTLHSREPSVSGRAGWRNFWTPGPRSDVTTSVGVGTGVVSSLASRLSPDETTVGVQPSGKVTVRNADASESASYVATRELRLTQGLFARWSRSDDNLDETSEDPMAVATISTAIDAGFTIGLQRQFRKDQLELELGGAVQRMERLTGEGAMGSRLDRQLAPRARLAWRHDLTRRLAFSLDGGVSFIYPFGEDPYSPDDERRSGVFPVVGGTLALNEQWGRGTLAVRRDVSPNLLIAQNTVTDTAAIAAAAPLPWLEDVRMRAPKLSVVGSLGVTRTRLIDTVTQEPQGTIDAGRVDLGVTYTPKPGIVYALRYELAIQSGDGDETGTGLRGFYKNTIYFTFAGRFPDRQAGVVPRPRSRSNRADGRDLDLGGPEPVVPDVLQGTDAGDER